MDNRGYNWVAFLKRRYVGKMVIITNTNGKRWTDTGEKSIGVKVEAIDRAGFYLGGNNKVFIPHSAILDVRLFQKGDK
jgi:hypothetical protein